MTVLLFITQLGLYCVYMCLRHCFCFFIGLGLDLDLVTGHDN